MGETVEAPAAPEPVWRRFGLRNWLFLVFVGLLVPLALALEASGPRGPDSGGGIMLGLLLFGLGSAVFMVGNLVALVRGLRRGQGVGKALIGLALPPAIVIGVILADSVT